MTPVWSVMDYRNTETKLDQLVAYFNEEKINLSPVFQRGRVWDLKMRRELIKNILIGRPIPAIFLYKDEAGSKFSYNILDGKQRLESILMFIGGDNNEFAVKNWSHYIFDKDDRKQIGFAVDISDGKGSKKFAQFTPEQIRNLREYQIPTVEIALNESTQLDEIVSLFVDINQYGAKVTRLNIVRAIKREDPLLKDVYSLIAEKQKRKRDVFVRRKNTAFRYVLKHVQIISSVTDSNAQADRMWEKLFELATFVRSGSSAKGFSHRKPSEILRTFIKAPSTGGQKLSKQERATLANVFEFLETAYKASAELRESRLAADQTHFYAMTTALIASDLLSAFSADLAQRLLAFSKMITSPPTLGLYPDMDEYLKVSVKQTTDATKRKQRQELLEKIVKAL